MGILNVFATFLKYEFNAKLKVKTETRTVWNPETKGKKLIQVFPSGSLT